MVRVLSTVALAAAFAGMIGAATAADLPKNSFKAVGTWGNLSNYTDYEGPFWSKTITEHSNGAITAHAPPLTELGLWLARRVSHRRPRASARPHQRPAWLAHVPALQASGRVRQVW